MYVDKELLVASELAVSASGANYSSAVDLGVAANVAKGKPLYLVVVVDELFAGTGTTMQVRVVTATASNLITNQKILVETPAIAKASLTAGRDPIVLALPPMPESGGAQRYLGADFRTDNTFETTGKVTAFFTSEPESNY
uniref:Uncharacterized protein n=1 Tax=viral metagenome TaxID=1070528 RepID=A0A6M3JXK8_9ZZZZ